MCTSRMVRAMTALTIAITMFGAIALHTPAFDASAAPKAAARAQSTPVVDKGESIERSHDGGRGTIEVQ